MGVVSCGAANLSALRHAARRALRVARPPRFCFCSSGNDKENALVAAESSHHREDSST
jgi:hypothetical protein